MILKPVKTDRDAKNSSGFEIGDEVEGLGGFVLEDADGSVLMDYRFEGSLLRNLGTIDSAKSAAYYSESERMAIAAGRATGPMLQHAVRPGSPSCWMRPGCANS